MSQVKRRPPDEDDIAHWYAEQRGEGKGASYKPWINSMEIAGHAPVSRIPMNRFGKARVIQVFSGIERAIAYMAWWERDIVELREQMPLRREATREFAKALGIKHPVYPTTQNVDVVMTIDFLLGRMVNGKECPEAILGKSVAELEQEPREIEKLNIVRALLESAGIPTRILLDCDIPEILVRNIMYVHGGQIRDGQIQEYGLEYEDLQEMFLLAIRKHSTSTLLLPEFCSVLANQYGKKKGDFLQAARQLLYSRAIQGDMYNSNLEEQPVASFIVSARPSDLRLVGA